MTTQSRIYDAVRQRGYVDTWARQELAVRQLLKRAEELSEQAELCYMPAAQVPYFSFVLLLGRAAKYARQIFDDPISCRGAEIISPEEFVTEAADQLVTLAVEAEALGVDYGAMALAKAEADVERGVRA